MAVFGRFYKTEASLVKNDLCVNAGVSSGAIERGSCVIQNI